MAKNKGMITDTEGQKEAITETKETPAFGESPAAASEASSGENKNASASASSRHKGYNKYMYMGPTLTGSILKEGEVYKGTIKEIENCFSAEFEKYPQIINLFVPIGAIGDTSKRIRSGSNVLNKYYRDIVSLNEKGGAV